MTQHGLVVLAQWECRSHMHPPIPAVIGDTGGDLDDTTDKPLDGVVYLFTLQLESRNQVHEIVG